MSGYLSSAAFGRRRLLAQSAGWVAGGALALPLLRAADAAPRYRLSLGQWSFHRAFKAAVGAMRLETWQFPALAAELGFQGVDYSGILLGQHHAEPKYLAELNRRAADAGIRQVLILVDLKEPLGAADAATRRAHVARFRPWLDAAETLGCSGIRVNPFAEAGLPAEEQARLLADGVAQLLHQSAGSKLNILLENHGEGLQTDGAWIASVVRRVNHPRCGTLPDFGNFQKDRATGQFHDRHAGVQAMLPLALAVCAKSHDFAADGNECYSDYPRLLQMVAESHFRGWIEVEYEGPGRRPGTPLPTRPPAAPLGERDGVLATRRLLEKLLGDDLAAR